MTSARPEDELLADLAWLSEPPLKPPPKLAAYSASPARWPTEHGSLYRLAAFLVGCAIVDFLIFLLTDAIRQNETAAVIVYFCFGIILAQGGILSVWLCLSAAPLWQRLVSFVPLVAGLVGALFLGIVFSSITKSRSVPFRDLVQLLLTLPLVAFAVQSPLWLTRFALHWRLSRSEAAASRRQPLSIAALLLATTWLAVALAAARAAPTRPSYSYWFGLSMFCLAAAAVSAAGLVPAFAWLMRTKPFRYGLLFTLLYSLAAMALVVAVMTIVNANSRYPRSIGWEMVGACTIVAGFTATTIAAALVARACGYRRVVVSAIRDELLPL